MQINLQFNIGETVFIRTDGEQKARLVRSVILIQNGIQYGVSCNETESWHFDFELSKEKDVLKSLE